MAKKKAVVSISALDVTLAAIDKQFGKGSIMRMDLADIEHGEGRGTGILGLDLALGCPIPKGRIIEIYGPESSGKTTLTLHITAHVQANGGKVAFIDAEHALDIKYASDLGVNVPELLISQPNNGEEALEITNMLTQSGSVDVVIVDSVAALTPKKELEGDMGDSHMGLQARLMSQAMRKLTTCIAKSNTTVIFINQLRMKIGVMFGCFHYDARIQLADGTSEKIGKIVNQKMEVDVLTYNKNTDKIESKPIKNWFKNGKAEKLYQMIVKNPHGSGRSSLPIADDHLIPTPNGEIRFKDLNIGDKVYIKSKRYMSPYQKKIALGMFLGDSSLRTTNQLTYSLRTKHGIDQSDYCRWKYSLFPKDFIGSSGEDDERRFWFDTKTTSEFLELNNSDKIKEGGAIRHLPLKIINELALESIAIWYLDDGNFGGSYKYWGNGKSRIYATKLDYMSKVNIGKQMVRLGLPMPSIDKAGLIFYGKDSFDFQKKIAYIIPECMRYKLHPKLRKIKNLVMPIYMDQTEECLIETEILDIYEKHDPKQMYKFDLEIEDNHNYFVDNVLVHNSPETTTGGNALKYYATQRIDIRGNTPIKDGDVIVGKTVKVKVVKNKVAPPFRVAELDITFGKGVSKTGDILALGVKYGIIEKAGAWFSYLGNKVGQGKENSKLFLEENDDIRNEIKEKILTVVNTGEIPA